MSSQPLLQDLTENPSLKSELPSAFLAHLPEGLHPEDIRVVLPFDISENDRFLNGWLVVDGEFLWRIGEVGSATRFCLSDFSEIKVNALVGNGRLEARVKGEPTILVRFTMQWLTSYGNLERYLNRLIAGSRPPGLLVAEPAACPRCGQPIALGTRICPRCLDKWSVFRRLLAVARPQLSTLLLVVVIFAVSAVLRLIVPQFYRILIDDVIKANQVNYSALFFWVGMVALSDLIDKVIWTVRGRSLVKIGTQFVRDLRQMVFARIQTLSLEYVSRSKPGDLLNRVTNDTSVLQNFLTQQADFAFSESIVFLGAIFFMLASNWQLALLVLAPIPLVTYLSRRIWKMIARMYRRQGRTWDEANSLLQDVFSGIRVVKVFGQENREAERFKAVSAKFRDITGSNEQRWNVLFPSLGFITGLGQFLVLYYGGQRILNRQMALGELVQFSSYATMLYGPLTRASFIPRWFTEAMTAANRIFEVIDEPLKIDEAANAVRRTIQGAVVFDDVSFGYHSYAPVLHHINLEVKPGEVIGLVGHSGAGKSTVINLLSRFYDPNEGRILIDGIDLRDYARDNLHAQLGMVLQETFLFAGTIYENITYAYPDATLEQVIQAAKVANAHDFIIRFTDGYDTRVGERGQLLSGGERQRIAIARAVLHNPRILILDEATASVDSETEMQIQQAMFRLMKDRTCFIIAHRLATLRNADRILVLEKGWTAEMGTHEELIKAKGIYHRLVMAQLELSRVQAV